MRNSPFHHLAHSRRDVRRPKRKADESNDAVPQWPREVWEIVNRRSVGRWLLVWDRKTGHVLLILEVSN